MKFRYNWCTSHLQPTNTRQRVTWQTKTVLLVYKVWVSGKQGMRFPAAPDGCVPCLASIFRSARVCLQKLEQRCDKWIWIMNELERKATDNPACTHLITISVNCIYMHAQRQKNVYCRLRSLEEDILLIYSVKSRLNIWATLFGKFK